jgi:Flp pilus assembly pilin Flp
MRSERGQATVEWAGLLLLVALALLAVAHVAPSTDGKELGRTVLAAQARVARAAPVRPALPRPRPAALPRELRAALPRELRAALPRELRAALPRELRAALPRAGRAAGAVWRKAWFACLVYERIRYGLRHPESRLPGYTFPYGVAARIVARCVSPVDLLRDLPAADPGP